MTRIKEDTVKSHGIFLNRFISPEFPVVCIVSKIAVLNKFPKSFELLSLEALSDMFDKKVG